MHRSHLKLLEEELAYHPGLHTHSASDDAASSGVIVLATGQSMQPELPGSGLYLAPLHGRQRDLSYISNPAPHTHELEPSE